VSFSYTSERKRLYESIYRCICCASTDYANPDGVCEFATKSPRQTIPVSHFGDIENAKIWLILTNPKGDHNDSNVGHLVSNYNVRGRENLTVDHVDLIFQYFSTYFQRDRIHPFFNPFMALLDGLIVDGHVCTFQNGGICAVDVIKCPTIKAWQQFVRTVEGKKVWHNCLGRVRAPGPNHFIIEQIKSHEPPILIFAQTTAGLIGVEYKGDGIGTLQGFDEIKIFRKQDPRRLSIALGRMQNLYYYLNQDRDSTQTLHNTIQKVISNILSGAIY